MAPPGSATVNCHAAFDNMSHESVVYITAMTDVQLKYLAYLLVWNMCYYRQVAVTAISREPRHHQ